MFAFSLLEQPEVEQHVINIVRQALNYAFKHTGDRMPEHLIPRHSALAEPLACFVSLNHDEVLRGCVGTTFTSDRLDSNIAWYAHEAAFFDPRFDHISKHELPQLAAVVSIMSVPLPMQIRSEENLLEQLIPFKDGLMLQYGQLNGVFLPCMWQEYPTPEAFVNALKQKAGWPAHVWTDAMRAWVFQTHKIEGKIEIKN